MKTLTKIIQSYRGYVGRRIVPPNLPYRFWIEPTSVCNLHCDYCLNKDLNKPQLGHMSMELYRKIIDEIAQFASDIYLQHRGESVVHPKLPEMIAYAKAKGLKTKLHNNATLLTVKKSEAIIDAGLDFISFSFDGYVKKTYEENRKGGNFEKTLQNILDFLRIKKEKGRKTPFTQLQVMEIWSGKDPQQLTHERESFSRNFDGLALDRLDIRTPHNWAGGINPATEKAMHKAGKHYVPCTFPWYSMTLLWNGEAIICPQDFMGKLIMGNANDQSIKEIWNGEKSRAMRRSLIDKKFEDWMPCLSCDKVWRRTFLGVPTDSLLPFLQDQFLRYTGLRRLLGKYVQKPS